MFPTNHFSDRESSQAIRVEKVTDQFASITVIAKLTSTYMMPVAMYDTDFVGRYRPLDIGEVKVPDEFRPPANWDIWLREGVVPARIGETVEPERVVAVPPGMPPGVAEALAHDQRLAEAIAAQAAAAEDPPDPMPPVAFDRPRHVTEKVAVDPDEDEADDGADISAYGVRVQ